MLGGMVELAATIFVGFVALLVGGALIFGLVVWPYMKFTEWRANGRFRREQELRHAERRAQRLESSEH